MVLYDDKGGEIYRNRKAREIEDNNIIQKEVVKDGMRLKIFYNGLYEDYLKACENSLTGIFIVRNGEIIYSNKITKDTLSNGLDSIHEADKEKFDEMMKNGKPKIIRIRNGKEIRWVEMVSSKMEGFKDAVLVNMVDITERVKIQKEMEKDKKKMQQVLEKERKFLEEISHYFFNPLCIAKGYLDLSIPNADPDLRRRLEITKQAVTRVETVVKHIVTEGRIYE
ncbi:MAG: hypothetical protein J7K61_06140 [Thermoplasmata archaeon]|nr:hypothetical protein [Thermoplasmata archaeon]